ncbi:MAG: tail fiber domain-containing protein [Desulfurellales bacterium]|nr:MAG: tail fiber domain-containing protein [Desulfurellales bacterium]
MWQLPFTIPDGGRFNGSILGGGRVVSDLVIREHGTVQSEDWVLGSSGWIIHGDGSVEFNNGVFRGAITASTIDIGGSDATSFHVDVNGNLWAGAGSFASAKFSIANTGAGYLNTSLDVGTGGYISIVSSTNNYLRLGNYPSDSGFPIIKFFEANTLVGQLSYDSTLDCLTIGGAGGFGVYLFSSTGRTFALPPSGEAYLGNGSGQVDVNLILKETSHSSSKRSAIIHENVGQIGVDINGNGTRDWYIYDSVGGYTPFVITFASGRADIGGGFGPSLGPWVAGGSYACFAHNGMFGTSASYALLQDNLGNTYINSPSGQETFHRIANTTIARTTGAGFYVSMPGSSSTTDVVDGGSGLLAVFTSRRANKKNIAPIPNPIQKFMALNPVTYQWRRGVGIDGDRNPFVDRLVRHGFVAEELAEVDHDLASWGVLRPFGHDASPKSMNDTRPDPTVEDIVPVSINVRGILALTVAVVQELVRRIEALEST